MGALHELYFKLETLETLVKTLRAKNEKGVSITVSENDEAKKFTNTSTGKDSYQNLSAFVAQSKEAREAGKEKYYVANGKTFWRNGSVIDWGMANKPEPQKPHDSPMYNGNTNDDDLPF